MNQKPRLRTTRLLSLLAIAYLLVVVVMLVFQRRLIYFPTKIPAAVVETVAREHGFIPWKNSAGQIIGWKIPAAGAVRGNVLICHGNAGCALGRDYLARPIHAAGDVDVLVLEYPGYGARPGSPSRKSLLAAAGEALDLLPANRPVYLVGESLGVGVACEIAGNHPGRVAGVALFAPYADLAWVAQRRMPLLPAYFLLQDRFQPAACLNSYHGPVQFVVAGADEILGAATGKKLYERYGGPKRLTFVPDAGHNEVENQSVDWWRSVFAFWRSGRE